MGRPNKTPKRKDLLEGAPGASRSFRNNVHIAEDSIDQGNLVDPEQHALTTVPVKLELPDLAEIVLIRSVDATRLVWVGRNADMVPGGAGSYPLRATDPPLRIRFQPGNDNELFAAVETGTAFIYTLAIYTEA